MKKRFGASPWRKQLLNGLKQACDELHRAGCRKVYLDGSFVTAKEIPGDYDGCWAPKGVDPEILDPVLLDFSNRRAAQKEKYHGELFVSDVLADLVMERTFLEFFQTDKETGRSKGIVLLELEGWK